MKKNSKFFDLLTSVDVLNTLNGGTSEPSIILHEEDEGREIRVRVPGIEKEAMQVEVHNNNLSIYYVMPLVSGGKELQVPKIVYNKNIPYFVDITRIHAQYEGNELRVQLPFNPLANGYHKSISIDEE